MILICWSILLKYHGAIALQQAKSTGGSVQIAVEKTVAKETSTVDKLSPWRRKLPSGRISIFQRDRSKQFLGTMVVEIETQEPGVRAGSDNGVVVEHLDGAVDEEAS